MRASGTVSASMSGRWPIPTESSPSGRWLKRAHKGTFHKISPKHLQRYVNEFAGRHGIRDADTIDQMQSVIAGIVGRRLMYRELIAD